MPSAFSYVWAGILWHLVCGDFTGMANSFLFLMFLCEWLDLSERAEMSFDYCSVYIIWCHVAYSVCVYVFCFLLFVCLFFPNVTLLLCWLMSLILHCFISHINDDVEGNVLMLEHICWLFVVPYSNEKQKTMNGWWERFVWRSQRDLPCYLLLPFVHGVGSGEECPAHSVFSLSL